MKKGFNITFSALFTALICILSQISLATPTVPITLQILGVVLCGFTLRPKWALGCIITYITVGALGMPVFSAFQGGIPVILGPTGGFILGFIPLTVCCSLSCKYKKTILKIVIPIVGLLICHAFGVLQYSFITSNNILISFLTASLPFVVKDIILTFLGFFMSKYIKTRIKKIKT